MQQWEAAASAELEEDQTGEGYTPRQAGPPTIFKRDPDTGLITRQADPECWWVFNGRGMAMPIVATPQLVEALDPPLDYDGLRAFLIARPIDGILWTSLDDPTTVAQLRLEDFPFTPPRRQRRRTERYLRARLRAKARDRIRCIGARRPAGYDGRRPGVTTQRVNRWLAEQLRKDGGAA